MLRLLVMLTITPFVSAEWKWIDIVHKGVTLGKSVVTTSDQQFKFKLKNEQAAYRENFEYKIGVPYISKNIDNLPSNVSKVEQDKVGYPVVFQKHPSDQKVTLKYFLMPKAYRKLRYQFPQDFMVEVPLIWLMPHRSKSLDQVAVLGTHNCFANPVDGFLYFQQQNSMKDQFEFGGVRMFRPAWHNPSGSIVDAPNIEPILCHADDDKCATSSLASRGFRPHKIVRDFNQLVMNFLQEHPNEIIIVCLNNYLTPAKTDAEIEKISNLSRMVLTLTDLNNKKYQAQWGGHVWPTLDWMLRHNKRVLFINDVSTRYTIEYEKFVRRNQYGTASIVQASKPRSSLKHNGSELVELSWFQNVSLPLHDINALKIGVELYWKIITSASSVFAQALGMPQEFFGFQRLEHQQSSRNLQKFLDVVSVARSHIKLLLTTGMPYRLVMGIQELFPTLKQAVRKIEEYVPAQQDNSLKTLSNLVKSCRATGVISPTQIPNIVMLDFATTTGDGIIFVNLINMLMDQKLNIQFVDVGGFCYQGKQIVTQGIL